MLGEIVQAVGAYVRRVRRGRDTDPEAGLDHGDTVTLESDMAAAAEVHYEDSYGRRTSYLEDDLDDEEGA